MQYSLRLLVLLLIALPPWIALFGSSPSSAKLVLAMGGAYLVVFAGLAVVNDWLSRRERR